MHYTLVFKVKGVLRFIHSTDLDALTTIAASFDLCHVPYQLVRGRTLLIDKSGD